ncbi:TPA: hypothetical protein RZH69_000891 [Campylobacter coli]|uniref:hypothetical protein n=1 Tax=Campylobacter coli TaxID=195 RepID=UPI000A9F2C90|nr:hypothetical protein [Campylobacter coli]HEB7544108.1 hypothetical protein [Campylobacter coli]HEB7553924.1 hypothetical protein [Campylobacter coli]HEB7555429.1 hypothetical protein [Campylobacter coli]
MKISEKYTPFELESILLYDKDTYKIVAGKAYTNKDEKFCIGLESNGFPINFYLIFPPQFNLELLRILLGQDGAK